jgi:outer membrane immunogenic protein
LAAFLVSVVCAQASEFSGPYAGIKLGQDWSNASGVVNITRHDSTFFSLNAGYNLDISLFVIGAEIFSDFHHSSTTYKDVGIDAKLGMPFGHFMPYARFGLTGSSPDMRPHGGVGVEYKASPRVAMAAEWTLGSGAPGATRRIASSISMSNAIARSWQLIRDGMGDSKTKRRRCVTAATALNLCC